MAYTLRTKDNAGDNGRAADQNESVDNDIAFQAVVLPLTSFAGPQPPAATGGIIRQFCKQTGLADNTATTVFTTNTTNEAGDNDSGVFGLRITGIACHGIGPTGETAVWMFTANCTRAINAAATAGMNAVTVDSEHYSYAYSVAATKGIASVALQAFETSEYEVAWKFTVDLNGTTITTASVYCMVEMFYAGFTTAPTITSAG